MAEEPNKQVNDQELNGTGLFEAYRRMLACYFLSTIALGALIGIPAVTLDVLNRALDSGNQYEFPILTFVALAGAFGAFLARL
jgi:hypothetical protein